MASCILCIRASLPAAIGHLSDSDCAVSLSVVLFLLPWVGQCCTLGRCVVLQLRSVWQFWSSARRFPVVLDGWFPQPLWNQREGLSEVWALAKGQEAVISAGHNHIHRLDRAVKKLLKQPLLLPPSGVFFLLLFSHWTSKRVHGHQYV